MAATAHSRDDGFGITLAAGSSCAHRLSSTTDIRCSEQRQMQHTTCGSPGTLPSQLQHQSSSTPP